MHALFFEVRHHPAQSCLSCALDAAWRHFPKPPPSRHAAIYELPRHQCPRPYTVVVKERLINAFGFAEMAVRAVV